MANAGGEGLSSFGSTAFELGLNAASGDVRLGYAIDMNEEFAVAGAPGGFTGVDGNSVRCVLVFSAPLRPDPKLADGKL